METFGRECERVNPEIGQQLGDGFGGGHRGAPVGVHGVRHDAVGLDRGADQLLGDEAVFPRGWRPADDVAAVDVDQHVQVVPVALGRSAELGDVPRPHLRGAVGNEFRLDLGRVGGLTPAVSPFCFTARRIRYIVEGEHQ